MKAVVDTPFEDWNTFYQEVPADDVPWELGGPSFELIKAVKEGLIVAPARVLDVGCGLGSQSIFLAKQGFDVVGIDIAETAITKAEKLALFAQTKAQFQIADITAAPIPSESFDIVYDRGCFQHLQPTQQFAYRNEISRLTTDGGTLLLAVFNQAFPGRELEVFFEPVFELIEEEIYSLTEKGTNKNIVWRTLLFEKLNGRYSDAN